MATSKTKAKPKTKPAEKPKADLSIYGEPRDLKKGDKAVLAAEVAGFCVGIGLEIVEPKHGGVMFTALCDGKTITVAANQLQ